MEPAEGEPFIFLLGIAVVDRCERSPYRNRGEEGSLLYLQHSQVLREGVFDYRNYSLLAHAQLWQNLNSPSS